MPFTRKQIRLFMSKDTPLSQEQVAKLKTELHNDPSIGHAQKGRPKTSSETHAYDFRDHNPTMINR